MPRNRPAGSTGRRRGRPAAGQQRPAAEAEHQHGARPERPGRDHLHRGALRGLGSAVAALGQLLVLLGHGEDPGVALVRRGTGIVLHLDRHRQGDRVLAVALGHLRAQRHRQVVPPREPHRADLGAEVVPVAVLHRRQRLQRRGRGLAGVREGRVHDVALGRVVQREGERAADELTAVARGVAECGGGVDLLSPVHRHPVEAGLARGDGVDPLAGLQAGGVVVTGAARTLLRLGVRRGGRGGGPVLRRGGLRGPAAAQPGLLHETQLQVPGLGAGFVLALALDEDVVRTGFPAGAARPLAHGAVGVRGDRPGVSPEPKVFRLELHRESLRSRMLTVIPSPYATEPSLLGTATAET